MLIATTSASKVYRDSTRPPTVTEAPLDSPPPLPRFREHHRPQNAPKKAQINWEWTHGLPRAYYLHTIFIFYIPFSFSTYHFRFLKAKKQRCGDSNNYNRPGFDLGSTTVLATHAAAVVCRNKTRSVTGTIHTQRSTTYLSHWWYNTNCAYHILHHRMQWTKSARAKKSI